MRQIGIFAKPKLDYLISISGVGYDYPHFYMKTIPIHLLTFALTVGTLARGLIIHNDSAATNDRFANSTAFVAAGVNLSGGFAPQNEHPQGVGKHPMVSKRRLLYSVHRDRILNPTKRNHK